MQIAALCLTLMSLIVGSCWTAAVGGGGCEYGWALTPEDTCVKLFMNKETWSNAKASCRSHGSKLVTLPNRRMIHYMKGFLLDSDKIQAKETPDAHAYQTIQNLDLTNKNYVKFTVKACNDAHLTLQPTASGISSLEVPVYEIILGGWGNTRSVIKHRLQGAEVASNNQSSVVDCSAERLFWISWAGGKIRVGRSGSVFDSNTVILEHQDTEASEIKSLAVSTGWGATGSWKVYNQNGALDHIFWIGGKRQSGIWRWDGVSRDNIAVTDWQSGQPNNVGGNEDCVEHHMGVWNDKQCSALNSYICERRPTYMSRVTET